MRVPIASLVLAVAVALALVLPRASLAQGGSRGAVAARISVQPVEGPDGAVRRRQIARLVRGHGFRVVTSVPGVVGTGQYPSLAREHRLAAFVTADLEEHKNRQSLTMTILIWDGTQGAVLGRWSASAPPKKLAKALERGFWKHLGPALEKAQTPPSSAPPPPAPPMRIDASAVD